ncbi:MAG: FAD binding domain-containing protein [Chloroflexi bacterium]|nr:FAD binding domain-containing protein [Chloroflexota bacterium]
MVVSAAQPRTLDQALHALESHPDAQLLAGGTDFVVEVNFGHRRPAAVVGLRRVEDLKGFALEDDELVLRSGLTYREMETELTDLLPGLADAARTVGSPQIRNAGTLGGNLGTASPAGDTLPVLAALDADVVVAAQSGTRRLPVSEFILGPKRCALAAGEIIREVRVRRVHGSQHFLKVGTRNAMVIAIASCALVVDRDARAVRCGLGSVGPVPVRPREAEAFINADINWRAMRASPASVKQFGELVAAACQPITDHRSTEAYRRHAVQVIATRALERSLHDAR